MDDLIYVMGNRRQKFAKKIKNVYMGFIKKAKKLSKSTKKYLGNFLNY